MSDEQEKSSLVCVGGTQDGGRFILSSSEMATGYVHIQAKEPELDFIDLSVKDPEPTTVDIEIYKIDSLSVWETSTKESKFYFLRHEDLSRKKAIAKLLFSYKPTRIE